MTFKKKRSFLNLSFWLDRVFFVALKCCWAWGRSEHPAMPQAHSSKGECHIFLSGMPQHSQSFWYSSWHFGFWKLWQNHWGTGPGLGPISLQGQPGASRTFLVISIATNHPPSEKCLCRLLPSSTMKGVHTCLHLFCPFFTFLRRYSFSFHHLWAGWKWVRGPSKQCLISTILWLENFCLFYLASAFQNLCCKIIWIALRASLKDRGEIKTLCFYGP